MAIIKNLNSDYIIKTPLGTGSNITLSTDTVYIPGNLTVLGSTTAVATENTTIKDNIIILNDGETAAGVGGGTGTSGVRISRGTLANVEMRWDEQVQKWQLGTIGGSYANILVSTGTGTGLSAIVEDTAPVLGGNVNTNGFGFYANVNTIFNANVQLNNVGTAPVVATDATVLYAATPNSGQAGLYVVNQASTNEELVTKRRAFGFSLIL